MNDVIDTRPHLIYVLKNERTGEIRYVGQTVKTLERRLSKHITEKGNSLKCNWIKSLKNKGLRPTITLIQEVPYYEDWVYWEMFWIKLYRDLGCRLVNGTDGGEGRTGHVNTEEHIEKTRQACMKPVAGYTYEGKFIDKWESATAAGRDLGISNASISECCNRRLKTVGDCQWRYWSETLGADIEPVEYSLMKPIGKYGFNGKFIKKFDSITMAMLESGASVGDIVNCAKGIAKSASGFQWRYISDTNGDDIEPYVNLRQKKRIARYTLGDVFIDEWRSAGEVARVLGVHASSIRKCAKGRAVGKDLSAYGFIWKYID